MKTQGKPAGNLVLLDNNNPISAETERIQSQVRQRAYELSLQRGHAGREVEDWLTAESEVISVPPLEMTEKDGTYQLRLAIAGVRPEDLNVMAAPGQMLVKCEFHHDHAPEAGTVHTCDFRSATVFRSIDFPEPIDTKSVKTGFQDGILLVTAARQGAAQAPPARKLARKAAAKRTTRNTRGAA